MPLYRDKQTGKVVNFDHEPTEQELNERFLGATPVPPQAQAPAPAAAPPAQAPPPGPDHSMGRTLTTEVAAPMAGFTAGGAVGGKPGAVLGATAGQAMGDLYNTVADYGQNPIGPMDFDTSKLGPNAPPSMYDEMKRLLGAGTSAAVGAYVVPPLTKAIPGPISLKNAGLGFLTGTGVGSMVGHPGLGGAIGAAAGGYNALSGLLKGGGNLSEALTTPRFGPLAAGPEASGLSAAEAAALTKQNYSPEVMARLGATRQPQAPSTPAPTAGPGMMDRVMGGLRSAGGAVSDFFGSHGTPEAPPPSPRSPLALTKTPGDIAERLGVTGQPAYAQPDMSRNPEVNWSADVSAAPQRTPQLTQTSPTDPQMPWEEHVSRSNPKRTSPGGQNWSTPEYDPNVATPPGTVMHGQDTGPLSGLQAAGDAALAPSGVHDQGLERWVATGGDPAAYMRMKGSGLGNPSQGVGASAPHPFGPNTVGAAQVPTSPKFNTVDEAEGMSLLDQGAFDSYKRNNPGADVDQWFRTHGQTEDTNAGLDIPSMVAKLTALLKK